MRPAKSLLVDYLIIGIYISRYLWITSWFASTSADIYGLPHGLCL